MLQPHEVVEVGQALCDVIKVASAIVFLLVVVLWFRILFGETGPRSGVHGRRRDLDSRDEQDENKPDLDRRHRWPKSKK